MTLTGFDHIVLCVADVFATIGFYERTLGMEAREEGDNKWALFFGTAKISLQTPESIPDIARNTWPGTANFCLVTQDDMRDVVAHLESCGVTLLRGPGQQKGALGPMQSVYFNDPDGNLIEVCEYG